MSGNEKDSKGKIDKQNADTKENPFSVKNWRDMNMKNKPVNGIARQMPESDPDELAKRSLEKTGQKWI